MVNQFLTSFLLGLLFFCFGFSLISLERDFAKTDLHIYGILSEQSQNASSQIEDDLKERFPKASIGFLPQSESDFAKPIIAMSVPVTEKESRVKAYLGTVDNVDQWISDTELRSALQRPISKLRIGLWAAFLIAGFLAALNFFIQWRTAYSARKREIEVWRSLGATKSQVFRAFALKQLFFSAAGFVVALTATSAMAAHKPERFDLALSKVNIEFMLHTLAQSLPVEIQVQPQAAAAPSAPLQTQSNLEALSPPVAGFWDKSRSAGLLVGKQGISLKVGKDEAIKSVLDGTVVYDGTMKGLGRMIIVDHGRGLHSVYAHLGELKTRIDDRLQKGQIIGYTGGSDFYFELRQNGRPRPIDKIFK